MANDFKWSQSSGANGQKKKKEKNGSSVDKAFELFVRASSEAKSTLSETIRSIQRAREYDKYRESPQGQAELYRQRRIKRRKIIQDAQRTLREIADSTRKANPDYDKWLNQAHSERPEVKEWWNQTSDPVMKFFERLQTVGGSSPPTTERGRQAVKNIIRTRRISRREGGRTAHPDVVSVVRSLPKDLSDAWRATQKIWDVDRKTKRYDSAVNNFQRAMNRRPRSQAAPDVMGKK